MIGDYNANQLTNNINEQYIGIPKIAVTIIINSGKLVLVNKIQQCKIILF